MIYFGNRSKRNEDCGVGPLLCNENMNIRSPIEIQGLWTWLSILTLQIEAIILTWWIASQWAQQQCERKGIDLIWPCGFLELLDTTVLCVEIHKIIQSYIIEDDSLDARICLFPISNEAVGIASVVTWREAGSDGINHIILMPLILWLARCSLRSLAWLVATFTWRCWTWTWNTDIRFLQLPTQMGL